MKYLRDLPVISIYNKNFRNENEELLVKTGDLYVYEDGESKGDVYLITEMDSNVIFSVKLDLSKGKVIEG